MRNENNRSHVDLKLPFFQRMNNLSYISDIYTHPQILTLKIYDNYVGKEKMAIKLPFPYLLPTNLMRPSRYTISNTIFSKGYKAKAPMATSLWILHNKHSYVCELQ